LRTSTLIVHDRSESSRWQASMQNPLAMQSLQDPTASSRLDTPREPVWARR
jgi:hypothetical protein